MSKSVWKYEIKEGEVIEIGMPKGAKILRIDSQRNNPVMWALVDTEAEKENRFFVVYGTGHRIVESAKDIEYIGTYMIEGGYLVAHLFELIQQPHYGNSRTRNK